MRFVLSEVAEVVGGVLAGPDAVADGATIDSRAVSSGQLFVPVVGARDGHDYIAHAVEAGAAAHLTARPGPGGVAGPALRVGDTQEALTALGRWARSRITGPVIAITGSAGKTSTKDLVAAAIAGHHRAAVSERSHNNELGVPLTLLNGPEGASAAVVEMGARGPGHIAALCAVASPGIAVVTNVSAAHTETLGSVEGVARAKSELVEALPSAGVAVLNATDPAVAAMASLTSARVVTFGVGRGSADVSAVDVALDGDLRLRCRLETPAGPIDAALEFRGVHHAANVAAAVAAALAADVPLEGIAAGLAAARPAPWRMEVARTSEGALVLNDAYNAGPASMAAALEALAATAARRRVAVLGPMLELGERSAADHLAVAALAASLGVELVAVGTGDYGVSALPGSDPVAAVLAALGPLGEGDAVLVKASRAAGLERVALRLLDGPPGGAQW